MITDAVCLILTGADGVGNDAGYGKYGKNNLKGSLNGNSRPQAIVVVDLRY
jgi:hypothetical protein